MTKTPNMTLKQTRQPVTPLAYASSADVSDQPERPGRDAAPNLTWC